MRVNKKHINTNNRVKYRSDCIWPNGRDIDADYPSCFIFIRLWYYTFSH